MTLSNLLTAPLTVIVGITGRQGGSVARALIASDKPYRLRGLSRDITKPAAQAFAEQGVEMVAVNLSADKPEDALKAFAGADIAFEIAVGKMLSSTALTNGRFPLAQFCDSKAAITAYARESGVPLALAMPGFLAQNIFIAHYALKRQDDGSYWFTLPISGETRVPLSDTAHDYGLYVQVAIESPDLGPGSEVRAGTMISLHDIVAQLAQVSGKRIEYKQIDREVWLEGFPPAGKFIGPMLGDMFQTFEAAGFFGEKLPTSADILARKPRSWMETLEATPKDLLPA
ncbi:hypothetical protein C8R44DRAFT_870625 [Mycena epipterygia]|nr:hypothetical protein C8R44DRAFT_870625 [Mycena epipterygia]